MFSITDFQETLSSYQDPAKEKIKDLINGTFYWYKAIS